MIDAILGLLPYLVVGTAGFLLLTGIGWILTRLRGNDGPLTPLDSHTARDHLRSRWF